MKFDVFYMFQKSSNSTNNKQKDTSIMKKAIVLGIMAFFAINIATVQNANAQDKQAKPTKTEMKKETKAVKECDKAGKDNCCTKLEDAKAPAKCDKSVKAENKKDNLKMKPKEIKAGKKEGVTSKKEDTEK